MEAGRLVCLLSPCLRTGVLSIGMFFLAANFGAASPVKPHSASGSPSPAPEKHPQKPPSIHPSAAAGHLLSAPPTKAATEFIPNTANLVAAEGNAAFSRGNFKKAVQAYQEVLRLAPNNLVALVNLGVAQSRTGNTAAAEKILKHALSLHLETGVAWLTLGTIYIEQNRLDAALAALTQARLYDSQNPHVHNYLGVVMNRLGWSDAAEAELRTAVELDTAYSDAHYNLAVVYMTRTPPALELAKRHYYIATQCGARRDISMEKGFKNYYPSHKVSHSSQ